MRISDWSSDVCSSDLISEAIAYNRLPLACLIVQRRAVTVRIEMGMDGAGKPVLIDIEELLATRLLVQGNSGSGKSHLLRRLLEGSAKLVQQVVIDPEGDFVTLAEVFGHSVVEAAAYHPRALAPTASPIRAHRASAVLT